MSLGEDNGKPYKNIQEGYAMQLSHLVLRPSYVLMDIHRSLERLCTKIDTKFSDQRCTMANVDQVVRLWHSRPEGLIESEKVGSIL